MITYLVTALVIFAWYLILNIVTFHFLKPKAPVRVMAPGQRLLQAARSLWNLRQFVEKIGLSTDTNEINPNEWMNQQVGLVIGMEKNLEGELRSAVKSLFAAEDAPAREADEPDEEPEEKPVAKKAAAAGRARRR